MPNTEYETTAVIKKMKNFRVPTKSADRFLTNTYFMVTPFVGFFDYPYKFTVSEAEIERLIEVQLIHLLEDKHFEVKPFKKDGHTWMVHYYRYGNDVIWGVTGFLLSNFLSIVFDCERNIFS